MSDKEIVDGLIANDRHIIKYFFYEQSLKTLTHICRHFFPNGYSALELIGEFYEFLSADNWHKLRIFKYTCSLDSYISIIASRYFQRKRDKRTKYLEEVDVPGRKSAVEASHDGFFMEDINKVLSKLHPFDSFLVRRILIEGEKPGDILYEAQELMKNDKTIKSSASSDKEVAGYVYTRYNRALGNVKKQMRIMGYGVN